MALLHKWVAGVFLINRGRSLISIRHLIPTLHLTKCAPDYNRDLKGNVAPRDPAN